MNRTEHLTQEFIHRQLDGSQAAVEQALLAIYDRQTQEERIGRRTISSNGVGFNKLDAEFCTSLVHRLKSGKPLTSGQLPYARQKVKKYWRQLVTIMTEPLPDAMVDIPETFEKSKPKPEPVKGKVEAIEAMEDYASW
jgi:hypothetical protein